MFSSEKLLSIFDQLPTPHAILRPDIPVFTVDTANKAYKMVIKTDDKLNKSLFNILPEFTDQSKKIKYKALKSSLKQVLSSRKKHKTRILSFPSAEQNTPGALFHCRFIHTPVVSENGEITHIIQTIENVPAQPQLKEKEEDAQLSTRGELQGKNEYLEDRISKKTAQYEATSQELNDFIYSVSHDLRAPLRRIDGFSLELINEHLDQLNETGAHYLRRVRQGAQDMGNLIDDLLKLSRISRRKPEIERVNLTKLAKQIFNELNELKGKKQINLQVAADLWTSADAGLAKVVLTNLLSNAIKFSYKEEYPSIKIGESSKDGVNFFFIQDNGAGFDPQYSDKLFKAFDRLHSQKEFKGTGIGLATVKRIVNLHGGTIWAEGQLGEGAVFYFNFQVNT